MQKLVTIKVYISLDINQIKEISLRYGIILVVCILAIIIVGFLVDNYKKDSYIVKKYNWVWQRNKKIYLISVLRDDLGIIRVYSRKALQKKWNKKTLIPFLREVYGNAK